MLWIRNDLFRIRIQMRIRIQPILFRKILKLIESTPQIQSKKKINQIFAIFYFILQSYSTHSPEFTGLKLEITVSFYLSVL